MKKINNFKPVFSYFDKSRFLNQYVSNDKSFIITQTSQLDEWRVHLNINCNKFLEDYFYTQYPFGIKGSLEECSKKINLFIKKLKKIDVFIKQK